MKIMDLNGNLVWEDEYPTLAYKNGVLEIKGHLPEDYSRLLTFSIALPVILLILNLVGLYVGIQQLR